MTFMPLRLANAKLLIVDIDGDTLLRVSSR